MDHPIGRDGEALDICDRVADRDGPLKIAGISGPDQHLGRAILLRLSPPDRFETDAGGDFVRAAPLSRRSRSRAARFAREEAPDDPEREPRARDRVEHPAEPGLVRGLLLPIHDPDRLDACFRSPGRGCRSGATPSRPCL